ncbi:MAG: hypothetical protein J5940_05470, partial [Clostridia bacterium]|nr:hypothetical protein [Clostridia bacterium]
MQKQRSHLPKAILALLIAVSFMLAAACCAGKPGIIESNSVSGNESERPEDTETAGSDSETAVS